MIRALSASSPLLVGVLEEVENTYLKTFHCEERSDVAISLTHSVILKNPVTLTGRRENLILLNLYEEKNLKKMRSSRGKAPLRMTLSVSVERSSRPQKMRAQDD